MMELRSRQGVEWGEFPAWSDDPRLIHAFSTRIGGVSKGNLRSLNLGRTENDKDSNIETNRRRIFSALSVESRFVVHAVQVHSANVAVVHKPGIVKNCDGLITDQENLFLIIGVADCHTVFIASQDKKAVGALHAGWRGIVGNILPEAVSMIGEQFGYKPEQLEIGISPGIGSCCYEIGPEVAERFPDEVLQQRNGSWYADLNGALLRQAEQLGIPASQIDTANRCTSCEDEYWYSYRRDNGVTGRMWGIIGRKGA